MARMRPQEGRYHVIKRITDMMVATAPGHYEWRAIMFWDVRDTEQDAVLTSYRTYGDAQFEVDHRNAGTWVPGKRRRPLFTLED